MAPRHYLRLGGDRSTSSTAGVGRMNLDSRPGYWHPPKRPRQCQKRVGRPESRRPCETFLFSLLKARSANETASGLKPIAKCHMRRGNAASWGKPDQRPLAADRAL